MIVIGTLSGTSADGIDVVIVDISQNDNKKIELKQLYFETVPFSEEERQVIFNLFEMNETKINKLNAAAVVCKANFILGKAFGNAVKTAIERSAIKPDQISLVSSHGQTIWHDVVDNTVTSTLQIGEPAVIAEITGITTVADFRVADVAAGGQGAPLTSIFDYKLLRGDSGRGWRAIQNIGGIGNVTFIPDLSTDKQPIAFDTGPGNVLIDWYTTKITNNTKYFDQDGNLAKKGTFSPQLLDKMIQHKYFSQPPPKTTGRELFSHKLGEEWVSKGLAMDLSEFDILATSTELTALSIALSYHNFPPDSSPSDIREVIVGGGGSRNSLLMERLLYRLKEICNPNITLLTHEDVGINSDAKESLLFALLGWLCVSGNASSLPSCTGASSSKILGKIVPGSNFKTLFKLS